MYIYVCAYASPVPFKNIVVMLFARQPTLLFVDSPQNKNELCQCLQNAACEAVRLEERKEGV